MQILLILIVLMLPGTVLGVDPVPQELLRYVQEAKRSGVDDAVIERKALEAGWQRAVVVQALASTKTASQRPPEANAKPAAKPVAPQTLDKSLVLYIEDARKLGLNDDQIKQNAIKAGWQAGAVTEALAQGAPPPASARSESKEHGVPDDYRIGAGDLLQIMVWKEPDASVPSTLVRPDGKIAVPILKEIDVAGLTPTELEKKIAAGLSTFISEADVTVVVTGINSRKAYVIGAVRREGPMLLQYRMTILQALSEAGGLTDYAKKKKIYLLRTENGKQYRLPFNYEAVIRGEQIEQNIQVMPGDTIVVPQ